MSTFETSYQPLRTFEEDDGETPPNENIIHVVPENGKARWNHIENLDEFFTRVYHYHQRNGFLCMFIEDALQLLQLAFVVLFSTYLIECVHYDILFANVAFNVSHKVTIPESVIPINQCIGQLNSAIVICLIIALVFWMFRFIKIIYNVFRYSEIRAFYINALKITADDMSNMTWHEVQRRMLDVQKEQQMCIHKQELSELDIYHRILRFKNYMIAMVNKSILSIKYPVPFFGEYIFLSSGLKYNLEMILFWGPWSPWENYWHLKSDFKSGQKRKELAEHLAQRILWIGIANFVLCPVIFLWQILYSFFRYAELIKREPGSLGARRWSHYARLYLRHFNELDHEFNARLSRGYRPASKYMAIFTSPLVVVLAKNILFFAGSVLAVLIILTVIDEDTLSVEHILTTMTILGVVVTICRNLIPDEHMVACPETRMERILAQIHYIPDHWKGSAHTYKVRDEFAQLYQYKCIYLLEELFSPIITPLILCFSLRHKSLELVDFYRNFTVEVIGVGDVCSFAQMDIKRHGNPEWVGQIEIKPSRSEQAEHGKTELSLMHFTLTNPEWKPPEDCSMFLTNIKEEAQREMNSFGMPVQGVGDNALFNSINTLSSMGPGYTSVMSSLAQPSMGQWRSQQSPSMGQWRSQQSPSMSPSGVQFPSRQTALPRLRGGVSKSEGPLTGSEHGLLSSLTSSGAMGSSGGGPPLTSMPSLGPLSISNVYLHNAGGQPVEEGIREMLSAEMNLSALYMHELHQRHRAGRPGYLDLDDMRAKAVWQYQDQGMPSIHEEGEGNDGATSQPPENLPGGAVGGTSTPGYRWGGRQTGGDPMEVEMKPLQQALVHFEDDSKESDDKSPQV
ncbi:autophagy-related protein 9A-like [Lineus longissimus]|uniref:autophagy-related protein 9A-like n=1 Tax=Lineus longissimus TaxID=88925 RepID=UPI002B4F1421